MQTTFLEGEHISLRSLEASDVGENYLAWFQSAEVCRYNAHHRFPMTLEDLQAYVQSASTSRTSLVLAIVDKQSNRHIGNIALQSIDWIARSGELAIIIGEKDFWGKGIGREACALLIKHGFSSLNLNRIWLGTMEQNIGMQKIATALGFVKEGVLRQANFKNEAYSDGFIYGLLQSDQHAK